MNNQKSKAESYETRSDVPKEYTWAIEDLYASDEDWKKDLEKLKGMLPQIEAFQGKLGKSADNLLDFLKLQDEISVLLDHFANYSLRKADEDTKNTTYQGYKDQTMGIIVSISSALSFAEPEILGIPDTILNEFYEKQPALNQYRRCLNDILRKKAHILSDAEEKILAAAGELAQSPDDIYGLLNNADLTFESVTDIEGNRLPVTHASFISLLHNYHRNVRKDAFESLYKTYDEHKNTSAAILSAQMKQLNFFSKMRKYNSPLEAALDHTNVNPQVYYNLIDAVHENMDAMYKYVRLRKKLLKVDELHMYDLYVPMVSNAERDIPFAETKENIRAALSVLGEDYVALLDEGFNNRWIDIYENTGKRSGAYSCGCRLHPYVLLNYKNNLDSEFTTVHEMGHALHSYLSNKTQPVVDAEYVIFVAEVASTCNEALLMQYLLKKTTDKKERAHLINYFLEQFRTTLYRQTMFAEFELKMSQMVQNGESINSETACKVYHDLIDLYFGKDIVHDTKIDLEWARIPHFYYNFYVYQYATGFSAAIALSQKILSEGAPAVKAYKENFLSAGCSKDPVSILKDAGVDMSTKKPVEEALKLFDSLIDEMEELSHE
ncbi:MAG: oligoendopeptidase F [Lachnospiraceae bacterium]|nr:oligoendopeptidase F [Lachnospiraceae bacterium]